MFSSILHSGSQKIDFNARHYFGLTGYMMACRKGHKEIVLLITDHSNRKDNIIDLNATDQNEQD